MKHDVSFVELQAKALELGWDDLGVTGAQVPEEDIAAYRRWLEEGLQGDLHYMENQVRTAPEEFFPGAKTAILFVSNYKQEKVSFRNDAGVIASYARGRDYHQLHRKRLKKFIHWLEERTGYTDIARGFSDSAPVLEKALAAKAGLGWFGKNSLLIHRRFGTFFLLSGLMTVLDFPHTKGKVHVPRCGTCTRCLDACPTQAFVAPYRLDAKRCLSYHTIESKKPLPPEIRASNPGYLFGCDICQDVCPHNVRNPLSTTAAFSPSEGFGPYLTLDQLEILEGSPQKLYGTPLKRRGVAGLKHTLDGEMPL